MRTFECLHQNSRMTKTAPVGTNVLSFDLVLNLEFQNSLNRNGKSKILALEENELNAFLN